MAQRKYELTDETIEFEGRTLHRIRAIRTFGRYYRVAVGELGGFVESEHNLSHDGICWISKSAKVYDQARVSDDARLFDHSTAFGNATICDNAEAYDGAVVSEEAVLCGVSIIEGNITLSGDTIWRMHYDDNPSFQFFKSSLEIKDLTIETVDDLIRHFPEWYV